MIGDQYTYEYEYDDDDSVDNNNNGDDEDSDDKIITYFIARLYGKRTHDSSFSIIKLL